jgi:hypothetical protein
MAGIDDDHRTIVGRTCGLLWRDWRDGGLGIAKGGTQFGTGFARQRLHESGAVDLDQLEHQPRRLSVGGFKQVGIGDLRRPCEIEHDP